VHIPKVFSGPTDKIHLTAADGNCQWVLRCEMLQQAGTGGIVVSLVSKIDCVRLGMRCSTSARYAGKLGVILTLAVEATCF
jgi:hypothetical protein